MTILQKHISFVKQQYSFHIQRATAFKANSARQKKHLETAEKFKNLYEDIEKSEDPQSVKVEPIVEKPALTAPKQLRLFLTPDEIYGLPDDLIKELSSASADRTDYTIMNLLQDAGGVMSLDQILVGVYRANNEIIKRQTLTSRLYRMAQRNMIYNVPNKKGVYSLKPLTDEEAYSLLGDAIAIDTE